ncbi:MAG: hypothetical protein NTY34_05645 [Candidatus Omnitrophica bacterium]|nr:hypothetical protein [Candidatus Omnitrophota bacterium]
MSRKARAWIGVTLLAIILFNYLAIGIPLYRRMSSLDNKVRIFTKHSEDTYVVDVLKREMITIDKKIVILNCVAVSAAIIIVSWMIFGLAVRRSERRGL